MEQLRSPCEEDATMPQDIEKRFQHLLNEWLNFQQRAGFSGFGKEALFNNLVQPLEGVSQAHSNGNELSSRAVTSSLPTTPESHDRKTSDSVHCEQNTWNDFCKMLSDEDLLSEHKKLQGSPDACLSNREEQPRPVEQGLLEEHDRVADTQNSLSTYKKLLSKREKVIEEQQQVAAEREKEAAVSLAEVQKRSAELVVEESLVQGKRQQLVVLEQQLGKTLRAMQAETETVKKQQLSVQEQEFQVLAREQAVESQLNQVKGEIGKLKEEWKVLKQEQAKLKEEWKVLKEEQEKLKEEGKVLKEAQDKLREEKVLERKEKEAIREKQERLTVEETLLKNTEKELEGKCHAVESLARKLNARDKLLKNIQKQSEEERIQINDIRTKLDGEKKSFEDAKKDLELSRQNVDAARESLSKEREEAALYIKAADEKFKEKEFRLKQQEEETQQKHEFLQGLEAQIKSEQQRCHMLHTKVQNEQEKIAVDLTEQESNLRKRESNLERKEEEIKKNLQKLIEKRNLADMKLKQLKEIETRTESLENELHKQHQEHLQKVEWHTKDYQSQLEHLDTVKHDLQQKSADIDRRFQEARTLKKEVRLWQKEAEKDLNDKAEELSKGKVDLELQKQNLKNLQYEVERAGAKVIDDMMNLDQASSKLDTLREKLDGSQQKMQRIANHIIMQQNLLKERETSLEAKLHALECQYQQEQRMESLQKELKKRNEELVIKEATLSFKEQALKSREDILSKESGLKTKIMKENEQNSDSFLKIHYMITEEKLELSKNVELDHIKNLSMEEEAKRGETRKVEEQAGMLNHEMLQEEFARIVKERESLKCQQHELEETKNEVQDAKLTLAAQLRATKEMVVDASITAQKASREREALEQERVRLVKAQKEIEAALSAREAKISLDEKKLEKEWQCLEEGKKHAVGIAHNPGQARQLVDGMETSGMPAKHVEGSSKSLCGRSHNHSFNDHEPQLHCNLPMTMAHTNPRFDLDMINLWRENECAKIEREEKMIMNEISRLHCQHQDDIRQSGLKELSNDLEMACFPGAGGAGNNSYHSFQNDLGPSLEALQLPRQGSCDVHMHDYYHPLSDEPSDEFVSGSEAAFPREPKQHAEGIDRIQGDYEPYFQDVAPSQTRLENVMQSLVNARHASRSRLHRTKNLLQALPLSSGLVIAEVQQALFALTERLNLMEQMEDELADELREAYRIEIPDSEGVIVDKVELLCKMEEQQTLRAEWEEDMQCQLEKISILQVNSQSSSCFSTPIKRTVFDRIVSPPSTNQSIR